jgi:hypothetical protein
MLELKRNSNTMALFIPSNLLSPCQSQLPRISVLSHDPFHARGRNSKKPEMIMKMIKIRIILVLDIICAFDILCYVTTLKITNIANK